MNWARKIFELDLARSSAGLDATVSASPYQKYPPKFLVEFLHEDAARELCREAEAEMLAAIDTFLGSPVYAEVREFGMQKEACIERHFYHLNGFSFGIAGQIDLVYGSPTGSVTLVDWKSGDDFGEGDDSLQLAVYALWATEEFQCEPNTITICKAFLGSDTLKEFPVSRNLLRVARLKVIQDTESFARMHEYGCAGIIEAFTPCAQEAVCRGCSFATVCPEGKESLAW